MDVFFCVVVWCSVWVAVQGLDAALEEGNASESTAAVSWVLHYIERQAKKNLQRRTKQSPRGVRMPDAFVWVYMSRFSPPPVVDGSKSTNKQLQQRRQQQQPQPSHLKTYSFSSSPTSCKNPLPEWGG